MADNKTIMAAMKGSGKPSEDGEGDKKKVKVKVKGGKQLPTQYGTYSGIVTEKGAKDNPTETEATINMANYMKNNQMPASDQPSNVYRPQFQHLGVVYDRKKKQSNA